MSLVRLRCSRSCRLEVLGGGGLHGGHDRLPFRARLTRDRDEVVHPEHRRNATGRENLTLQGHAGAVFCLVLSTDGKRLYSGSQDSTIKVWDLGAGKETLTLSGHTAQVSSLVLSADGKRLYSGSDDRSIKVWDLEAELAAVRSGNRDAPR